MDWTEEQVEAAVGRMFPGYRAYIADGCEQHSSGVVRDAKGTAVASFRVFFRNYLFANEINRIREIRIGDVGQFCGTRDELDAYTEQHPELNGDDEANSDPPIIKVDMEVSRCRRFPEDDAVQVCGYVGDYEASVVLSADDPRVQSLSEH